MPIITLTIKHSDDLSLTFTTEAPYESGHVINHNEADFLNSAWAENVRKVFAKRIKALADTVGVDFTIEAQLQEQFAEYVSTYKLGPLIRRWHMDPVHSEMRRIARELIKTFLNKKGDLISNYEPARLEEMIDQVLEKKGEEIQLEAERRITALKDAAESTMELD